MADDKKPSEVLGGWNQQVAEQLGQIADNTGGEGTAQAGSEKRPSDVLGGWYKEVSDLLDDIATNTEGGGAEPYVLPTMSPTTKGGAKVGDGLTMDGTALSVDYSEVASVDALEGATALSPTGGIVSTQDGLAISPEQSSTGAIDGALLELTAKSKPATQVTTDDPPSPSPDYPQPIVTVRGRNLLNASREYSVVQNADWLSQVPCELKNGERYVFSYMPSTTAGAVTFKGVTKGGETKTIVTQVVNSVHRVEFVADDDYVSINSYSNTALTIIEPMITTFDERNLPYVPYGHVGLERRDSQGNLLDTTPIPLPSRGWVAGLPDGTADELTVDGAGKVVWDCKTDETTTAATDGITGTVGVDVMSTTGQIADGATVLYKHSTTEDCGYVNLPSMQDCVLSIPELDALGVRYTIGDGAEIARQWYERAYSEYEQRITDLEEAVAELTAGA